MDGTSKANGRSRTSIAEHKTAENGLRLRRVEVSGFRIFDDVC